MLKDQIVSVVGTGRVGRALLLGAAALSALTVGPAHAQAARPNVVVLMADDLGYGDLGAYGSPDALTPFLDDLAGRGLRFTDFYAGGPVCTPSRYALLTGLHTFRAQDDHLLKALEPYNATSGIADSITTLGEALRGAGYETALMGKWHLGQGEMLTAGAPDTEFHPLHHGFDAFYGLLGGTIDYNTHWNAGPSLDWWEDLRPAPEDSLRYATHLFGEHAEAFIDDHAGAGTAEPPFFLFLPVSAPHYGSSADPDPLVRTQLPLGEEEAYLSRFDDQYPNDNTLRKRFLAMVAVLDDEVGRIVDALERNGLMDDTVIWFLSDNGATARYGGSTGGFREGKGSPYEGGVRVPSFVVWEGHVAPGVTEQVAGNVDVLPTVAGLAGVPLGHAVDGLDLSGFLLGGAPVERGVAVPNTEYGDGYRLRRWKYVRRYKRRPPPELYDLEADPFETVDLAGVYPDTLALLESLMPYGTEPGGTQPPPAPRLDIELTLGSGAPVPPTGGAVRYRVAIQNTTSTTQTAEYWVETHQPNGRVTTERPTTVTVSPGATLTRTLSKPLQSNTRPGTYRLVGEVGAYAAGSVVDSDTLAFEKEGGEGPGVVHGEAEPAALALESASPNPFASAAALRYALPVAGRVRLAVYDVLGREVAVLVDGEREAGWHEAVLDGARLPSGAYLVRLESDGHAFTRPIALVR